eukprot:gene12340-20485_t
MFLGAPISNRAPLGHPIVLYKVVPTCDEDSEWRYATHEEIKDKLPLIRCQLTSLKPQE